MEAKRKMYSLMVVMVAALFMLSMAAPVMAGELSTFTGKITTEGKFEADNGRDYWLSGRHADELGMNAGKSVEIKGLLREDTNPNEVSIDYRRPSIEVYSYKWMDGMNEMK